MKSSFSNSNRWDGAAFSLALALAWLGVIMGFGPKIIAHVEKSGFSYPLIVHVHAFFFVLWMVFITLQIALIRIGRADLHRLLGIGLTAWAAAMVVLGPITALITQRIALQSGGRSFPAFLAVQFGDILIFGPLVAAGFFLRNQSAAHKRLMLIATIHITGAGYGRWMGFSLFKLFGPGLFQTWLETYLFTDAIILGIGLYDLVTRRRLNTAYVWGCAWMLAVQAIAAVLLNNDAWATFAKTMIGG